MDLASIKKRMEPQTTERGTVLNMLTLEEGAWLVAEVESLTEENGELRDKVITNAEEAGLQVAVLQSSLTRSKEENERLKGECICGHDGKLTSADCPRHGTIELSLADHAKRAKNLLAEIERLQRRADIWKGQATKYQQAEEWQIELRKQAEDALTRSKAEGRREALEEITGARLAELLVQYGVVQAPAVEDAEMYDDGATVGGIYATAAAIRQQAVQEGKE